MDTKLIEQYGEDILRYRLCTARQKKRMQYRDFEKHLIRLDREQRALYRVKRNLGWEPIIPPVQKGWKRFFVLRDDVARSRQAEFFQGILDKINTYDWSYRKNFLLKKRSKGKKIYVVKGQQLLKPWINDFKKMEFSESEGNFFYPELDWSWGTHPVIRFVFSEPWRFVLKIRPNMITKIKRIDAGLESGLKEIDNYMERNDYEGMLGRLKHGSYRYKEWKNFRIYDEVNPFKNKSLCQVMDLIKE